MSKIYITSLTDHRIDVLFADKYLARALDGISAAPSILIVTNGMYDAADQSVLDMMKRMPSIYLIDDHTCWIPSPEEYPLCTIYSQFVTHPNNPDNIPMKYFQVSKLALFDEKFDTLTTHKKFRHIGYWGQYKPERYEEYKKYIPKGCVVIGRRYPKELRKDWEMRDFTKDMDKLHDMISAFSHTHIFGDKFHNGVNLPYRIYEALMCGVIPIISNSLLGNQTVDIEWILDYINGKSSSGSYLINLKAERSFITSELRSMIDDVLLDYKSLVEYAPVKEELTTASALASARIEPIPTIDDIVEKARFTKDDISKPRISLIEPKFINGIAEILTFGAIKYDTDNWKKAEEEDIRRIKDSALRHFYAYLDGEYYDPESKKPHIHHVATNLMFLQYLEEKYNDTINS